MKDVLTIYVLKQTNFFVNYDIFLDKDASHYVQYRRKGEQQLSLKQGSIEELVGEYEYGEDKLTVELFVRDIIL